MLVEIHMTMERISRVQIRSASIALNRTCMLMQAHLRKTIYTKPPFPFDVFLGRVEGGFSSKNQSVVFKFGRAPPLKKNLDARLH